MPGTVRSTICVKIDTPVPKKWTSYPDGIGVGGNTYVYNDISIGRIIETPDGSSVIGCELTIGNQNNLASDLITDAANLSAPILITKVRFLDTWVVDTTEVWFEGKTGKPSFSNSTVVLACHMYMGRRGKSPAKLWSSVLVNHVPPAPGTKIPWLSVAKDFGGRKR